METDLKGTIEVFEKINEITKENYNLRKGSRQNFNFFYGLVTNTHLEKYHSNFIAYLLNPKETHDCDTFFANKFFETLKGPQATNAILNSDEFKKMEEDIKDQRVKVSCEKTTDKGRRIDIVVESKNSNEWIIFIENKFTSTEGQQQVMDYYHFCKKNYSKVIGIYLTKNGEPPTSIKDHDDAKNAVISLSYRDDIIRWILSCCKDEYLLRYPHILSSLVQYCDALKKEIGIMENNEGKKIKDYLNSSDKNKDLLLILKNKKYFDQVLVEIQKEIRDDFILKLVKHFDDQAIPKVEFILKNAENSGYKISCQYKSFLFCIRVENNFLKGDSGGKGLWWGVYESEWQGIKCKLKNGHWQTINLDGVEDYWDNENGSIKLLSSNIEQLVKESFSEIVMCLTSKVIPAIEKTLA